MPSFASQKSSSNTISIKNLTGEYCSEALRSSYNQRLTSISDRIPSRIDWHQAAMITIPVACSNNFNGWLAGLAFNLNLFALNSQTSVLTVESITPFLSIRTFGKKEYQDLAMVWQSVNDAHYPEEKLRDFFYRAIQKNYRAAGIYGAAVLYYQFILEGQTHVDAKNNALAIFSSYRQIQDIPFVLEKAVEILHKKNSNITLDVNLEREKIWHDIKTLTQEKLDVVKKTLEQKNKSLGKAHKKSKKKRRMKKAKNKKTNNEKQENVARSINQEQLYSAVSRWKKTPYRYGGNSTKGIDCTSFVVQVMKEQIGIDLPRSSSFIYNLGNSVSLKKLQAGDLIFFSRSPQTSVLRVGIYLGNDELVYVSGQRGVNVVKITDVSFQKKIVGAKRLLL